ncbi:Reducing polyketide synthase hmp8 [Colletotrichum gloeosporioides]|uniref:Reducing polyketide synthase hmp8 n=1 Tax=Colletotrichum gloeosporioides TaxID=474922 RepID=A0A8H4CKU2_COLGL|nr:Reducing polyketide synthase hmp8 [Colletotrichum gloeosporioides]KAF3805843.1 Reducing polyketide synthase hmp8 [Colletotrichum gloeosporioides]
MSPTTPAISGVLPQIMLLLSISSQTAQMKINQAFALELLEGYYSARKLVSPFLFGKVITVMVSLSATEEAGGKTLDLPIELGPHSALGGFIEQILSHRGISNTSERRRHESADCSLPLRLLLKVSLWKFERLIVILNCSFSPTYRYIPDSTQKSPAVTLALQRDFGHRCFPLEVSWER